MISRVVGEKQSQWRARGGQKSIRRRQDTWIRAIKPDTREISISVAIPTFNRPEYLRQAIDSVLAQDYRPLSIVISDDSTNDLSAELVADYAAQSDIPIDYGRTAGGTGEANNNNLLLERLKSDWYLLLHDDDLLCPGAISSLAKAGIDDPDVVAIYGKQIVVDDAGVEDLVGSLGLNEAYYRTSVQVAQPLSALSAALLQQFPNDGFLLRTPVGQSVRYKTVDQIGFGPDFDFGVRVALEAGDRRFLFIDHYTAKYRLSQHSIMRGGTPTGEYRYDKKYQLLRRIAAPEGDRPAVETTLRRFAPEAVVDAAVNGDRAFALQVLLGSHFTPKLSLRLFTSLAVIAFPFLAGWRNQISRARRSRP